MSAPDAAPATVRQLDTRVAGELAELAAMFEDLQSVLLCCERLVSELDTSDGEPDGLLVEALWTTAMLSYARCFSTVRKGVGLTEDDIKNLSLQGDVLEWHKVLRKLRKHYSDPSQNPREAFSVGIAQDEQGQPGGVAITSTRQPIVDEQTVRQTGAIAYELSKLVDQRIGEHQERVLNAAQSMSTTELEQLPVIDVSEEQAQAE